VPILYNTPNNYIAFKDRAYALNNEADETNDWQNLRVAPIESSVPNWDKAKKLETSMLNKNDEVYLKRIVTYLRWAIDAHKGMGI
jgi:hypothetical protein